MRSPLLVTCLILGACARASRQTKPFTPVALASAAVRPAADAPPLRLATWNIKRLGHGDTRLDVVADVIDDFDVVAVQEVMTEEGVRALLAELDDWDAAVSERAVGRNGYEERYAVLYRPAAVRLTRAGLVDDPDDDFVREPFVACFVAGRFDFCVLTIHVTFDGGARARDEEIERLGVVAEDLRAREPDVIVAGDFNRSDGAPGFAWLHDAGWACVLDPAATPTSIGPRGYSSSYDHLLLDRHRTGEWSGEAARVDLVAGPCRGDPAWCRTWVSDHAPVTATFRTTDDDD